MNILITGATGVIGRRVVPALVNDGHHVTAIGRSPDKLRALADRGAVAQTLDLFDARAVRQAVEGQDVVLNLATHVAPNSKAFMPGAWKEMSRVRGIASGIIARAAREAGVRRLLQESFAPIYADGGAEWLDESAPAPGARYNRAALVAESNARGFGDAVILRFAYFYGAGDDFTGQLVGAARKGWMAIPGRRNAYFPMITHDDAAAAVRAALDAPAGTYNVVDNQPMTRAELGDLLATLLDARSPRFLPAWLAKLGGSLGDTLSRSQRLANAKLRRATSWNPRFPSAREGLAHALAATAAGNRA